MPAETRKDEPTSKIPIRENLFTIGPDGRPRLIASRCKDCGGTFYPTEPLCPSCIKEGSLETVEIEGHGKIMAFTKVMRGLPGYDSPYVLACLQLNEGPSVIAQLEDWQNVPLTMNMPVELVIGKIKEEKNGTIIVGPKYKPVSA
jgi:uncharacterized OB-fold protein